MDVAAGRDVVVVLFQFVVVDDAAEFFGFAPADEGVGDALDAGFGDEVLGVALFEDLGGVDKQDLALARLRLGLVEEQHDAGGGGVVEEVFGQVEHALNEVVVDEPLADGLFLVGASIARSARDGAGVEDDGGAAAGVQAGVDVLDPAPVGGGFAGKAGPGGEAVEFVVVVVGLGEPVLIPHGIGDDAVEGAELAFAPEFGVLEGVADLDLALHVVNDHVHVGHGPGLGGEFLAEQFERGDAALLALGVFLHGDLAFHEQAAGAAGGVVDFHAGLRLEHAGHDGADLGRSIELAGALAAAFGELADQVFVALADDVGLDVVETEALGADGLDEVGEAVVVEVTLAVGGGVEIDTVDDALQKRVCPGDGAHVGGDAFADLVGELADDGPDGLLGIVRHEGEVKADEFVVGLGELESLLARANLGSDAVQFVIEDVAKAPGENEREDVVLVFRRVLGATDGTRGVPDPGFERFVFTVIVCQLRLIRSNRNHFSPISDA
ncbi:hypothetical protein DLNHIDIE_00629 [Acidithiobacillus thiooxidans ATCC 19377]|uniref:Uncharacterized protein n=1 Tax=Acidithiobacillus thiooxidans ATCC 19377 TaxID=637390 RepID=A0A543Q354_ACITH|nr:hypothetical protein DLNHIDIE_00629 [Acidithiobacillus thiooxidans ATCC 19377]